MTYPEVAKRRRLFALWVVSVATTTAAVSAQLLFQPLHARVLGLDVSTGLSALVYVSVVATCLTTIHWFRTKPTRERLITVQDLRVRRSDPDRPSGPADPKVRRSA